MVKQNKEFPAQFEAGLAGNQKPNDVARDQMVANSSKSFKLVWKKPDKQKSKLTDLSQQRSPDKS